MPRVLGCVFAKPDIGVQAVHCRPVTEHQEEPSLSDVLTLMLVGSLMCNTDEYYVRKHNSSLNDLSGLPQWCSPLIS
jgi:hypothetical protein